MSLNCAANRHLLLLLLPYFHLLVKKSHVFHYHQDLVSYVTDVVLFLKGEDFRVVFLALSRIQLTSKSNMLVLSAR
jgi:hypothetical protein